jgi:hypothetical protein
MGQDYCDGQLESNTLKNYNAMNPDNPLHIIKVYTNELYGTQRCAMSSRACERFTLTPVIVVVIVTRCCTGCSEPS